MQWYYHHGITNVKEVKWMQIGVIKGKIVEQYGSAKKFADEIGWSETKISRILTGKQDPSAKDVKAMAVALRIVSPADVVALFLFD